MTRSSSLLPLEEALDILLARTSALTSTEPCKLKHLYGRVAAEDLKASITQPPFDNSAVDGYAIRLDDLKTQRSLPVASRFAAGDAPGTLAPNTAARIFTGAPVPAGADCVIMQETAQVQDTDDGAILTFPAGDSHAPEQSMLQRQNIRPAGQDFKQGQTILRKGQVIHPQTIGLLASAGINEAFVFRPLRVAIMATGDELVEPSEELKPGQIYNSNAYMMEALLKSLGMTVTNVGRVADSFEETVEALERAAEHDIILSSGGASVGEEDYVKAAIEHLGQVSFWRIALKPGKPFMFGDVAGTPILGLPGNPSAVLVTFLILARPLLLKRQGCAYWLPAMQKLPLAASIAQQGIRRDFLRVRVNKDRQLITHPNQSSGMLSSACWAEGFAIIPEHTSPQAGDLVDFVSYASLMRLPETPLEIS